LAGTGPIIGGADDGKRKGGAVQTAAKAMEELRARRQEVRDFAEAAAAKRNDHVYEEIDAVDARVDSVDKKVTSISEGMETWKAGAKDELANAMDSKLDERLDPITTDALGAKEAAGIASVAASEAAASADAAHAAASTAVTRVDGLQTEVTRIQDVADGAKTGADAANAALANAKATTVKDGKEVEVTGGEALAVLSGTLANFGTLVEQGVANILSCEVEVVTKDAAGNAKKVVVSLSGGDLIKHMLGEISTLKSAVGGAVKRLDGAVKNLNKAAQEAYNRAVAEAAAEVEAERVKREQEVAVLSEAVDNAEANAAKWEKEAVTANHKLQALPQAPEASKEPQPYVSDEREEHTFIGLAPAPLSPAPTSCPATTQQTSGPVTEPVSEAPAAVEAPAETAAEESEAVAVAKALATVGVKVSILFTRVSLSIPDEVMNDLGDTLDEEQARVDSGLPKVDGSVQSMAAAVNELTGCLDLVVLRYAESVGGESTPEKMVEECGTPSLDENAAVLKDVKAAAQTLNQRIQDAYVAVTGANIHDVSTEELEQMSADVF